MAGFNNLGNVVLLPAGQQLEYFYFFNDGDRGLQTAGADIKTPNNGAKVIALDQRKTLPATGQARYFVLFRNDGPGDVFFNVQGGGAS